MHALSDVRGAVRSVFSRPARAKPRDETGDARDLASFDTVCQAYEPSGGVTWAEDLERRWRSVADGRSGSRLIVSREILSFNWRRARWIPMAQFGKDGLSLKPQFLQVWSELAGDMDGWEVASWFASPSAWLDQSRPVDLIDGDLPAVLQAARADRFVRVG